MLSYKFHGAESADDYDNAFDKSQVNKSNNSKFNDDDDDY